MKKLTRPLVIYFFVFIAWSIYRYLVPNSGNWIDNFLGKPIIWLLPTFFVVKVIEKKKLASIGLIKNHFFKYCIFGIGVGIAFFLYVKLLDVFIHHTTLQLLPHLDFFAIGSFLAFGLATGIVEEILFRGYLQTRLTAAFKSSVWGVIVSSLLFALMHIPVSIFVYHYSLSRLLTYEIYLFEVGILFSVLFLFTKTLTLPIVAHGVLDFLSDLVT